MSNPIIRSVPPQSVQNTLFLADVHSTCAPISTLTGVEFADSTSHRPVSTSAPIFTPADAPSVPGIQSRHAVSFPPGPLSEPCAELTPRRIATRGARARARHPRLLDTLAGVSDRVSRLRDLPADSCSYRVAGPVDFIASLRRTRPFPPCRPDHAGSLPRPIGASRDHRRDIVDTATPPLPEQPAPGARQHRALARCSTIPELAGR